MYSLHRGRQEGSQPGRQTCMYRDRHTDMQICIDTHTNNNTDKHTFMHTDRQTHIIQTNSLGRGGTGGSLVDSTPFVRSVAGPNPALDSTYRDLGQVLHSQLCVALRRETPCCV